MTQITSTKYNQLNPQSKKQVDREVSEIKQAGQNHFFIETGLQADDRRNYWSVVEFAMKGLGI